MKKRISFADAKRWVILLVFLFPILSCTTIQNIISPPTPTPTPTATPTATPTHTPSPTRKPLADLDLSQIVLQQSDLPAGYKREVLSDLESMYEADIAEIVLQNFEKGYGVVFMQGEKAFFINLILVYSDVGSAQTVYSYFAAQLMAQGTVNIPQIGDLCVAAKFSESGITGYAVFWLYQEALIQLEYFGVEDIGVDEMVRLAQTVQGRLEAA